MQCARSLDAGWPPTSLKEIEPGYGAVPRQLLVEPLLTHRGGYPMECKFFMFNGVGRLVFLRANYGDLSGRRHIGQLAHLRRSRGGPGMLFAK